MRRELPTDSEKDAVTIGEINRWEIHHPLERIAAEGNDGGDATFIRLTQIEPYWASTYLVLFAESDKPGKARLSMNLHPDTLDELIRDLTEAKGIIERRALESGHSAGDIANSVARIG